jgi:transcriptional regulator with XRE-family HTH domain
MGTRDGPGTFGLLVQQYRAAAGLSQEELAERAGLSRRGISDLERGARRAPHPATVRRLAEALNLERPEHAAFMAAARAGLASHRALAQPDLAERPARRLA